MKLNLAENKLVQHTISELSQEERLGLAVQLLKDLKPLKANADEAGFELLSFLLSMAVLEVQSIASGSDESVIPICGVCGFSYDADPLSEAGEISHEHIC